MYCANRRQATKKLLCLPRSIIAARAFSHGPLLRSSQNDPQLDFRAFVEQLRKDGDLADVYQEVDPNLEVGAIVRRVSETNAKAPFFHNVKGARDGLWKMFGNAASLRAGDKLTYGRIATSLGLPLDSSWKDILDKMRRAIHADFSPPKVLETGPCKQNKIVGDDIDLTTLPVPLLHQGDGGKYLQTWGVHVLQTPDKSWTNWSIFRGMVHDKRRLVCLVIPGQHNSMIRDAWLKQGKDEIPWALALGIPPAASIAAAIPLPAGVSEGNYVSALTGKPLEMVKCELSDLLVPANSEIVLEGTFSLKDKALEGPFEDYIGVHFEGESGHHPLFTVNTITYRDDAILPVSVPGRLTDESVSLPAITSFFFPALLLIFLTQHTTAAMASVQLIELLQEHGFPIKDAVAPLPTLGTWAVLQVDNEKLAKMRTDPDELCKKIGDLAFNDKSTMLMNRILLIGDDVDIHNWDEVIWAYTSRCRPGIDEKYGRGSSVQGGKMVSNCLLAMEYKGERTFRSVDFKSSYPKDIQERVKSTWTDMGFDKI
ncbi:hypothetical protein FAVG1_11663 [Fusarium avenaceum]|nr:hypothetical protein FAVG1_11663 [Fusarium avenaceum]